MTYTLTKDTPIAVIGAGSMGAGIAQVAAQAGHPVQLLDAQPGAADKALTRIAADLDGAVKRGRMDAAQRDAVLARLHVAPDIAALAGAGVVVEAIVEKLEVKQGLFKQIEAAVGERCVLATNTSSISITAIAQPLQHPQRVVGWHFFNPANRMKLVEIIPGVQTDPALVPALQTLSKAWGKTAVLAPNAPGFIVNRVARPFYAESLRLLAEGLADVPTIDRLVREAGSFAMGPFALMDLIGHDVNLSVTESVFAATGYDGRYAPNVIQQELVRAGLYGRKTGRGFHDYRDGAQPADGAALAPADHHPGLRASADTGLLGPLVDRLRGAGLTIAVDEQLPTETLALGDALVALTDGRTATERLATLEGVDALLLLDLARDYATTTVVGATASLGVEAQLQQLAAAFAPASIAVLALADVAGLGVMRVVACLANEAADVMSWTRTSAADIDTAMKLGTNYPVGPLAWAEAVGVARVHTVLANLQTHYGDMRYRRAPRLSLAHRARGGFHG